MTKKKEPSRGKQQKEKKRKEKEKENLCEIDVKEEGLFGVRDLDAVPLVGRRVRDVNILHCLCDALHFSLSRKRKP
jgi:hypothetical protein